MGKYRQRSVGGSCLAAVVAAALSVPVGASASSDAGSDAGAVSTEPTAGFTVSSFNVLGSSHTVNSSRYASGTTRIKWGAQLLADHGTDVVGFNELQQDQLAKFVDVTNGSYGIYPGAELLYKDSNNSIAWRKAMWELVKKRTFDIPYFDGKMRAMPVVVLRHKATGLSAYFINVHNPATNRKHPDSRPYRIRATTIEINLVNEVRQSGLPVFVLGDMNERDYYFCRMTGEAPMQAARGGTNQDGVCDAQKPASVSWIFGSKKLAFSGYVEDKSEFVQKITDHRVLFSDVQIDAAEFPRALSATVPAQ